MGLEDDKKACGEGLTCGLNEQVNKIYYKLNNFSRVSFITLLKEFRML